MDDLPDDLDVERVASLLTGGDLTGAALEVEAVLAGSADATIRSVVVNEAGDYARDDDAVRGRPVDAVERGVERRCDRRPRTSPRLAGEMTLPEP